MICCCNDTATTEIYTYGHTLSRHDALPSCSTAVPTLRVTVNPTRTSGSPASAGALAACRTKPGVTHLRRAPATFRNWGRVLSRPTVGIMTARRKGARSEEHTSELQSLMHISYAVFCLKKKI